MGLRERLTTVNRKFQSTLQVILKTKPGHSNGFREVSGITPMPSRGPKKGAVTNANVYDLSLTPYCLSTPFTSEFFLNHSQVIQGHDPD